MHDQPPPAAAGPSAVTPLPDDAEVAWRDWYEPERDIDRYMATSRYDAMKRAFLAAYAQGAAAERERIRRGAGRMPGEDWYDVPADLLDGEL